MTRERWAQAAITIDFLIIVRTLGEIFRLRHVPGFTTAMVMPYVAGALIAVCFCWVVVTLYFFRRYLLCCWVTLATITMLLAYKVWVIGM